MPPKSAAKASASSDHTYSIGDTVLGKVKGYPAWPGRICDPETANAKVAKDRPKNGKAQLVQFFPTGDFSWLTSRDVSLLTSKEIEAYVGGKKKSGDLLEGYKIAADPSEWITKKEDEAAAWEQMQEDAEADEDQLASDDEVAPAKKDKTKKRKRESAATNGKKEAAPKKAKKETTKAKANVKKDYTDDEAEPANKKSKSGGDSDAETVKGWRHKLQKIFLGKSDPVADEMPKCAEYFDAMEKFEMKKEWLIESKLAKVLKRIALLKEGAIPNDDEFKFRERSSALAAKWASILGGNANGSPKPEAAEPSTDAAPATEENGADSAPAEEDAAPAASNEETAEKKDESAAMDVETNGEGKAEESKAEDEPKKDAEAQPTETPAADA